MWQWFLVPLPRGINQLMIEAVLSAGQGNHNGIALDDVTVKPCEHFSESLVYSTAVNNLEFRTWRYNSNIRGSKSQNLDVSRLVLQLSLCNLLKSGVKSRIKIKLEQRRQAMLQLHPTTSLISEIWRYVVPYLQHAMSKYSGLACRRTLVYSNCFIDDMLFKIFPHWLHCF